MSIPTLEERIAAIQEEIDFMIDARAEQMKETAPGVPIEVLRALITVRGGNCSCRAYKAMIKDD